jgi:hypothetical protein
MTDSYRKITGGLIAGAASRGDTANEPASVAPPCVPISLSGCGELVGLPRGARHWCRAPGHRLSPGDVMEGGA